MFAISKLRAILRADVFQRLGIIDFDLRAAGEEAFDQNQRRRLADVVGARLEGQAPDGEREAAELAAEMLVDLL